MPHLQCGGQRFESARVQKFVGTMWRSRVRISPDPPKLSLMKNKIIIIVKLILTAFFSLVWFIFIQVEYELVTKPELQNDFPIAKGIFTVYLTGFIVLVSIVIILFLLYSIKKSTLQSKNKKEIQ